MEYKFELSEDQLSKVVKAWLLTQAGKEYDGFSARFAMREDTGMDIDHHVFIFAMDSLTRSHQAQVKCIQGWGDTKYRIEAQ
jgi:hypothetical protein